MRRHGSSRPGQHKRHLGPLLVVLGWLLAGLPLVGVAPASAAEVPPWAASGPGTVDTTSDGTAAAARFSYDLNPAGLSTTRSWTFATSATAAGQLRLPWTWTGFHAYFQVTATLVGFVTHNGTTTSTTLLDVGPTDCCSPPSNGFSYSGTWEPAVQPGDTYGFVLSGSNFDRDNRLQGTFTVQTAPYADPSVTEQNTSWPTASLLGDGTIEARVEQPGEARWYRFPVVPGSGVKVDLTGLTADLDLTVFRDIGAAFTSLTSAADLQQVSAEYAGDAFAPSVYSPSVYSPSVYSPSVYSPSVYSPSVYSPSLFAPSVYSPSVYSPSVYSPSVYSPSVYSPSVYSPSVYSPSQAFLDAFSGAQTRSLAAVSAHPGLQPETAQVPTYDNTGSFYVRVQGRGDATGAFQLRQESTGGPCDGPPLVTYADQTTIAPPPPDMHPAAVILTDTSRLQPDGGSVLPALGRLAASTRGYVVDLANSPRVQALNRQADARSACAYAKNLVAEAIRDIVDSARDDTGSLRYVVIAGDDSVIPFFRYPDTAGLGPESQFVPPVLDTSASDASLRSNLVLGQDAYGARRTLTLAGQAFPLPDLAVGRLVERPEEITAQVDRYLALDRGTLPTPRSALVTGYDFLTDAADQVSRDLTAGLGTGGRVDQLITDQGVPHDRRTDPATGPTRDRAWTADDLRTALTGSRHDIVMLAGHFSANSALAADFATSLLTADLEARPGVLANSLVLSIGCHSGYNIVDSDGVPSYTNGLDWAQELARQGATFVGGTGYQYGDTDFLAYSERLYGDLVRALRAGTAGTPVAVGAALLAAKQTYLAGTKTLSGIDRKALLEATVYGLPMVGVDLPGRAPAAVAPPPITTSPAPGGSPGDVLGLRSAALDLAIDTTPTSKPVVDLDGNATGAAYRWLTGPDGVLVTPAGPALPQQIMDVTGDRPGAVLRGVGLRSATYTDTSGVIPLTGAPTTEQNGVHTSFVSPAFWPQSLWSVNYFGGLGGDGRTRLVTTPAQYRSDPGSTTTNTERAYQSMGVALYYSANTTTYAGNTPALAAPPSIGSVTATLTPDGTAIALSAAVTGDPSAGIQTVWVTYTAESGPWHGAWTSLDLVQSTSDSTRWTAVLPLSGQDPASVRFIVQAVNGVGLVGMDNAFGEYYRVAPADQPPPPAPTGLTLDSPPATVDYQGTASAAVTLTGAPAGSPVTVRLGQSETVVTTDAAGHASAALIARDAPGTALLSASYDGDDGHDPAATEPVPVTVTKAPTTLGLTRAAANVVAGADPGVVARLTTAGRPLPDRFVALTVTDSSGGVTRQVVMTDPSGQARLRAAGLPSGRLQIAAVFADPQADVPPDPNYLAAASDPVALTVTPPDSTPPVVTVTTAATPSGSGWYNRASSGTAGVQVKVTADDPSGVSSLSCVDNGGSVLSTSVSAATITLTDGRHALTCTATDTVGNTGAAAGSTAMPTTLAVDQTPPVLTPTVSPTPVVLAGRATASPGAADATSGVVTASCTAPSTSNPGPTATPCTATDVAGNTATAAAAYVVTYAFSGFQPPVANPPAVNSSKAGRAYPIKVRLADANGQPVSAPGAVTSITYASTSCSAFSTDPTGATKAASPGGAGWHYDDASKTIVFVWATPRRASCYTLFVTLADSTVRTANFQLN